MKNVEELVNEITSIMIEKQRIEEKEKDTKKQLLQLMNSQKIDNLSNSNINIAYVDCQTRRYVDKDKLYNLFPDVAVQCVKDVIVEPFLKVCLKEGVMIGTKS